jgi:hypothetical protein
MIDVLETFNGMWFVDFPQDGEPTVRTGADTLVTATTAGADGLLPHVYVSLNAQQLSLV